MVSRYCTPNMQFFFRIWLELLFLGSILFKLKPHARDFSLQPKNDLITKDNIIEIFHWIFLTILKSFQLVLFCEFCDNMWSDFFIIEIFEDSEYSREVDGYVPLLSHPLTDLMWTNSPILLNIILNQRNNFWRLSLNFISPSQIEAIFDILIHLIVV